MRWLGIGLWVGVICVGAGVAWGQGRELGYRLYDAHGQKQPIPDGVVAGIALEDVLKAAPGDFESGAVLVPKTVAEAEKILRKPVGMDATDAQRKTIAERKRGELQFLTDQFPGKALNVSVSVVDIVALPAPKAPNPLWPDFPYSKEEREAHAAAVKRYEEEKKVHDTVPLLVIGKLSWASATVTTEEDRRAIAEAKAKAEDEMDALSAEARRATTVNQRQSIAERRARAQEAAKKKQADLREKIESRKPPQLVYLLGTDEQFKNWKREQTRGAKGVVYRAGLFAYNAKVRSATTVKAARLPELLRDARPLLTALEYDQPDGYVGAEVVVYVRGEAGEN